MIFSSAHLRNLKKTAAPSPDVANFSLINRNQTGKSIQFTGLNSGNSVTRKKRYDKIGDLPQIMSRDQLHTSRGIVTPINNLSNQMRLQKTEGDTDLTTVIQSD